MLQYDVIVVGAGIVGATAALNLAQKTSLRVALLDAAPVQTDWQENTVEQRVSAITLASQRIFQRLNVWDGIQARRISPYKKMHVWDESGNGKVNFDSAAMNLPALGFIIEDAVIRSALLEKINSSENIDVIAPVQLLSLEENDSCIELKTADKTWQAKLIIAADGANSWVREAAQIPISSQSYHHDAITATVKTSLPHDKTARQRFLTGGPLAFLPLADEHTCSIVWSTSPEQVKELLAMDDAAFKNALANAFNHVLGDVLEASPRKSFPLQRRHAKKYVQERLALIGDAAHTIHPLAGQGVNLGLLDAVCLVETIEQALTKKRDYASVANLRRYERWRKSDNLAMLAFVEAIKYLFGQETKVVKQIRNAGLNFTNQASFIKNFFAEYAAGNRGDLPALAQAIG
jgi:2-octaprenylphenol hydroxylase